MIDEKIKTGESPTNPVDAPKKRSSVNTLTIFLALAFLLILLAESVAASSLSGGIHAPSAINYTKEFNTCVALGKSEEKCNKTATAWAQKTPTLKNCYPYKEARAVDAGETFDAFISWYNMTTVQRDEFIKINGLSPAYPKTIIYAGVRYCLPYGVDKKGAEDRGEVTSFNPKTDFGWQIVGINGYELTFELFNFERYDKVNVYFWNKPPAAFFWKCRLSADESCTDILYEEKAKEVYTDGYSEIRKIWLGQFKVTKKEITLSFPQQINDWNRIYVCMHSLFRNEDDISHDKDQYYASYHNYCQLINLTRPVTTRIIREPAPTQTWLTYTPTEQNTPCGYVFYPDDLCRPLAGFWNGAAVPPGVCESVPGVSGIFTPETGYVCLQPCPGTRLPAPTNTACATQYGPVCPGTRIPRPTPALDCPRSCQIRYSDYHIDPIFTPTYIVGYPTCQQWWNTPAAFR